MTDQDKLRDRIEDVIWKRTTLSTNTTTYLAQAIIDEFGLTIEPHCEECEQKVIEGWWGKQ